MITAPKTERQRHFLEVSEGRAEPQDERERLWLRVQIICRFPAVAERSARADLAEHRNAALEAEILQLRRDLRDAEGYAMEILEELRMHGGDFDTRRKRSICKVVWMSPKFAPIVRAMGPPAVRMLMTPATRGVPTQVLQPSPVGIGQ